jgi:hypothetical protein
MLAGLKADCSTSAKGRAALAGYRGEAHEDVGLLPHLGEYLGLGVPGDVVGDIFCSFRFGGVPWLAMPAV